jgi:hypothetical protein
LPKSWDNFEPTNHPEFQNELRQFRGNDDLNPNFSGGEGRIFLTEQNPLLALKRWFRKRIGDMARSIRLLEETKAKVESNPRLSADMEVVEFYRQGTDWGVRDFDPTSVTLKSALNDSNAAAARTRVLAELQGTTDPILQDVLKKIQRNSENVHWSPARGKILIIDMQ